MIPYWPTGIAQGMMINLSGRSRDLRASFETIGGSIDRPRTTGEVSAFNANPVPMSLAEFAMFEAWVQRDLKCGALAFCMRDPIRKEPRMWKIASGDDLYQFGPLSTDLIQVSLSLLRLPPRPWFAPYVPDGVSRIPDFVADYELGVYGIDGLPRPASALPSIEGDYLTVTSNASAVLRVTQTLTAGDITSSAPAGVTSIIGFRI